jgi:hypothetical protein
MYFQVLYTWACSKVESLLEIALSSIKALMMEATSISETSVKFYGTTRRKISEGGHI